MPARSGPNVSFDLASEDPDRPSRPPLRNLTVSDVDVLGADTAACRPAGLPAMTGSSRLGESQPRLSSQALADLPEVAWIVGRRLTAVRSLAESGNRLSGSGPGCARAGTEPRQPSWANKTREGSVQSSRLN